jgi:hypothetical protein
MAASVKPDASAPAPAPAPGSGSGGEIPPKGDTAPEPKPLPAVPTVPEKYDLQIPEESAFDAPFVERFAATAKESQLTQDQAKAVFNSMNKEFVQRLDAVQKDQLKGGSEYDKRLATWQQQIESDKEIGGANFQNNLALAKRTAATFFEPDVVEWLEQTGFGSHPGVVKAMYKIGKAMGEDKLVHASGATEPEKPKTASQKMYPDHYDEQGNPK